MTLKSIAHLMQDNKFQIQKLRSRKNIEVLSSKVRQRIRKQY
jgi:hypothetical protein